MNQTKPSKPATDKKTRNPRRPVIDKSIQQSLGGESRRILPSHIRADHSENSSRWVEVLAYPTPEELVPYFGEGSKICFTLTQIEYRLASMIAVGQIADVAVSVSGTGRFDLVYGYLRHCACLLAEARGVLDDIPDAKGKRFAGIFAKIVPAPKSQNDRNKLAEKNHAENTQRLDVSKVQMAFYIQRQLKSYDDNGVELTPEAVAKSVGLAVTSLARYLQLTKALNAVQLRELHEGKITMSAALKKASNEGRGKNTGPQKALAVSKKRNALAQIDTRPPPDTGLTSADLIAFFRANVGEFEIEDLPEEVQRWVAWSQAEKARKPAAAGKKTKAAPPNGPSAAPVKGDS